MLFENVKFKIEYIEECIFRNGFNNISHPRTMCTV